MELKEPVRYSLPINQWPESDQPREKLMRYGAFKLTDSELLAIILRTGSGKMSALDLARTLLQMAGSLDKLARKSFDEIMAMNIKGIGTTKAVTVCATVQLARRLHADMAHPVRHAITSSQEIASIYIPKLQDLKKEVFMAVFLDTGNKIICDAIISEGTINGTSVTPREVFYEAIKYLAASLILVHNHPSGNILPSKEDKAITAKMVDAGKNMCISVMDHLIIGHNSYYSFADAGLID
ncbi:MAG: DNA repair protein RadC [Candidatus Marinimicrobia bacterium]|nr:DNA repair protein RadC [Candidatus Neomarinimicrobiota bacterium]